MKKRKRIPSFFLAVLLVVSALPLGGCTVKSDDVIVLRVSNWEEYLDEGDWEEEDAIELEDGSRICPKNSMLQDFEKWFYKKYGKKVKVEYSTFGTNEELYNQITIGDVYDLVCPSEYMIMKMLAEDMLEPYSDAFFDTTKEENYYSRGVSPYIQEQFEALSIQGNYLSDYAAGYMWGILGFVYNPEVVSEEEASNWDLLLKDKFYKQITVKDSVRDAYFAGISISKYNEITDEEFKNAGDYHTRLSEQLNLCDENTVDAVEDILSRIKDNVYSFETDSGKADMVTGKVVANQQWSGDAVYTLDQAEEDGVLLNYATPREATNLWFDGWCMLKAGVKEDEEKQMAAEAFVNFVSMPENAVRNMDYIGYTSVISGGDDDTVFSYANWCYGADDEEDTAEYDVRYFFRRDDAVLITTKDQLKRQLSAQYPLEEVMERSVIMAYFDKKGNERMNQMWTNVRCFDFMRWFGK